MSVTTHQDVLVIVSQGVWLNSDENVHMQIMAEHCPGCNGYRPPKINTLEHRNSQYSISTLVYPLYCYLAVSHI